MTTMAYRDPKTGLIRDPERALKQLVETEQGELITLVPAKIHVPTRFQERGLATIGVDTFVYGMYALILEDQYYTVSNVNALIPISPFKIETEKVDGVEYHAFYFEPETVVIKNTTIVQRDSLIYDILDELIFKGKIPWYMGYEDLGRMFDTAKEYAGSNICNRYEIIELVVSMITRSSADRTLYYRRQVSSRDELQRANMTYLPLTSVFYLSSTLAKLAGNYFDDGVKSALVTPTERIERIEALLRA